jgi:hypothetical protein
MLAYWTRRFNRLKVNSKHVAFKLTQNLMAHPRALCNAIIGMKYKLHLSIFTFMESYYINLIKRHTGGNAV